MFGTISGSDATYASGNSGIIVYSNSGTQTATATFDNYFSAIPEPSTALLSGLGLLALLLRRRRV